MLAGLFLLAGGSKLVTSGVSAPKEMEETSAVGPLLEVVSDPKGDSLLRCRAARALSSIGAPRAIEPLIARLREPADNGFYQVFEPHFDRSLAQYEKRFKSLSAPLRRVVRDSVEQFLACGRLRGGGPPTGRRSV